MQIIFKYNSKDGPNYHSIAYFMEMISDEKFQQLCATVEGTSKGVEELKAILIISTPDHGCILDTIRSQSEQIKKLVDDKWVTLVAKTSISCLVKYGWAVIFLFLAKGFLVSVTAEALKLASK